MHTSTTFFIHTSPQEKPINLIHSILFVCQDKTKLIESIKDKGFDTNAGPQSYRGCLDSLHSFLSRIDHDYRNSLYMHHKHHCAEYHTKDRRTNGLVKKHFSFENIHKRIGGIHA